MEVHILKIFSQSLRAFVCHPVSIPIEEVNLDLGPHLANYLLNAAYWLQGPAEQIVKSSLAALVDLADVLEIALPCLFLFIDQFQSTSQYSVYKLVADPESIHDF